MSDFLICLPPRVRHVVPATGGLTSGVSFAFLDGSRGRGCLYHTLGRPAFEVRQLRLTVARGPFGPTYRIRFAVRC